MDEQEDEEEKLCYRQRAEKAAGGEVTLMQWSPTMDVIALAFKDHSVVLNRLSWQRVWAVEPAETSVAGLSWRPDGRVLAVGYSNGCVSLLDVEDGHCLHDLSVGEEITTLLWAEQEKGTSDSSSDLLKDNSEELLPTLPSLDSSQSNTITKDDDRESACPNDPKRVKEVIDKLNVLFVGDKVGRVHVCVSGVFLATSLELSLPQAQSPCEVLRFCVSPDFKRLFVMATQPPNGALYFFQIDTTVLVNWSIQFRQLSLLHSRLVTTVEYTDEVMRTMNESWEDSLVVMDTKLANYSSNLPAGINIADEFLILLACGRARVDLHNFLVDELTAKGMKKLGLSLEMSYNTLKRLIIDQLNSAIQTLNFHLYEALGLARWRTMYSGFNLSEKTIQDCIDAVGSFAVKADELLFVINDSLQNLRVFFKWMYTVILKLSGEPVPPGLTEALSAKDLSMITEFLKKRLHKNPSAATENTPESKSFSLEVVGQYLKDEDLTHVAKNTPGVWQKILQTAGLSKETVPWLVECPSDKSLSQLYHSLTDGLQSVFTTTRSFKGLQKSFGYTSFKLRDGGMTTEELSQLIGVYHSEGPPCYCYFPYKEGVMFLQLDYERRIVECARGYVGSLKQFMNNGSTDSMQQESTEDELQSRSQLTSLQCYTHDCLSCLVHCDREQEASEEDDKQLALWTVAQVPMDTNTSPLEWEGLTSHDIMSVALDEQVLDSVAEVDLAPCLTQVLTQGHFQSRSLSVSGSRRLAALLSSSGKRVRLFDVDAEEEEELEED